MEELAWLKQETSLGGPMTEEIEDSVTVHTLEIEADNREELRSLERSNIPSTLGNVGMQCVCLGLSVFKKHFSQELQAYSPDRE